MPGPPQALVSEDRYQAAVARLRGQVLARDAGDTVRLGKSTSNLFRPRARAGARLDVSEFRGVLRVDPAARTADVLGMTTYEQLVDVTLGYGLMPLVVPQLKTITLGGAVTGLGIESSSFRNGTPHESVLEMDILTGAGEIVLAAPEGVHRDLFFAFPNSYGTLGYALRLRIELEPVKPFVELRHHRFDSAGALAAALPAAIDRDPVEGTPVDFLDGTAFHPGELYLTAGRFVDEVPAGMEVSDYSWQQIYYRSIQTRQRDVLTVRDYLWRWDTDWFWCSRAFGVQRPWVRALLGRRWLRSDTYWRIVALEQRYQVKAWLDRRRGLPDRESVIQDVEVPLDRLAQFLAFLDRQTGIRPVWLCPLRARDGRIWPLYPLDPDVLWVNVGFWSTVALPAGERDGYHNRRIEAELDRVGGRKSLYSTSFYDPERFWQHYGGAAYREVKSRYDPQGRLLDLYAKTVRRC